MIVPESIKIGGVTYNVKKVELGDNQMGETDYEQAVIYLLYGLADDVMWKTFIHEVLHAILHEYGALPFFNDDNDTELAVQALTNGVIELIENAFTTLLQPPYEKYNTTLPPLLSPDFE